MPLSTILPPPQVRWTSKWAMPWYASAPVSSPGQVIDTWSRLGATFGHGAALLPSSTVPPNTVDGYGAVGTTGTFVTATRLNRRCLELTPTGGAVKGSAWRPPDWQPPFEAATMAPGATMDPGAVVFVFDFHVSITLAGAVPGWADDTSPVFFLASRLATNVGTRVPGGSGPNQMTGFGVFLNDVAGAPRYEYVSWREAVTGTPALERVTIPLAVVADHERWNTFRFIVTGAASGRAATLTVQANGTDVVVDREFGSALLEAPNVVTPGETGMVCCIAVRGSVGDSLFYAADAKLGRFLPSGRQLQAE